MAERPQSLLDRVRKPRTIAAGVLALGACIGAGAIVKERINEGPQALAAGQVECVSGRAVVGVWVEPAEGRGDFADWNRLEEPSRAAFEYSLPDGINYSINVGCGGSGRDWATSSSSGLVSSDRFNRFLCYDLQPSDASQGPQGICETVE